MSRRLLIAGFVVVLVAPLAARQGMTRVDAAQRSQIQLFEAVLQRTVLQAGERLATMAREVMPNVLLATNGDARARGIPLDGGLFFDVQVPDLLQTFQMMMQRAPLPAGPSRPVSQPGAVPTTTGPAPESAKPGAAPAVMLDPASVYTNLVRTAIIDAMLDNSAALSLKDDEVLTVAAAAPTGPLSNALNTQDTTSIFSIKGVDLAAFHQGKISRDEARKRVVEKLF